jgi:hypothetical protein
MSFPFAKPASMTSPNGGHRRQGDFTTDLRVVVIATTLCNCRNRRRDSRRRSSPAHRPVSIISFANKSCQPRFVPNNERFV